MYEFQLQFYRPTSPIQQQYNLQAIHDTVKNYSPNPTGFQKVVVDGVTVHENPFPEWLQQICERAGLQYRDINYTYVIRVRSLSKVQEWLDWCEGKFNKQGELVKSGLRQIYHTEPEMQYVLSRALELDESFSILEGL